MFSAACTCITWTLLDCLARRDFHALKILLAWRNFCSGTGPGLSLRAGGARVLQKHCTPSTAAFGYHHVHIRPGCECALCPVGSQWAAVCCGPGNRRWVQRVFIYPHHKHGEWERAYATAAACVAACETGKPREMYPRRGSNPHFLQESFMEAPYPLDHAS